MPPSAKGLSASCRWGGDGTLHEVVNGFFAEDGTPLSSTARLVPVAVGTGTDFRRALAISGEIEAVSLLRRNRLRYIDLLRIKYVTSSHEQRQRYAVNITSFGLSSRVAQAVNQGHSLPGSTLRYLWALFRSLAVHRPVPVALTLDGTSLDVASTHLAVVANGHSFGAGINIAPSASVDDGLLDLTVLHDVSVVRLLCHLPQFYRGTPPSLDGVTTGQGRRMTARPLRNEPVWLEADGELLGRLPATIEIVPDALRLQC